MKKRLERSFFPWLLAHFAEFWTWYLGATICLISLHWLQLRLTLEVKHLTDAAQAGQFPATPVLMLIGMAVGILTSRTLSRLLFFYPARVQQKWLRTELLEMIEATPPARYSKWNSGQVYQIIFNDFNGLRGLVGFALLQLGNVVIAGTLMIPQINDFDPDLWKAFIPTAGAIVIFSLLVAFFQRFAKKTLEAQGEVQQFLMETYGAKATVANFRREEAFIARFKQASAKELSYFFKSAVGFAISIPLINLGLGISLLWGAAMLHAQGKTASDLVYFSGLLFLSREPLMFLAWMGVVIAQGIASWSRVKELVTALQTPSSGEGLHGKQLVSHEQNYTYQTKWWDKDARFIFPRGKWSVVCGPTGVGKSWLMRELSQGLRDKGERLAMVQQEPYLFNDTIEENIFLGRTPTSEDLKRAGELLMLFGLDDLASSSEALLKLEVGENGKRLSGGQSKRVALVRSLMADTDVLIWDDPFSSVDLLLERKIMHRLRLDPQTQHKTIMMTSHRLSTVRLCDEAIMVDKDTGIQCAGEVRSVLENPYATRFFSEQLAGVTPS